MPIGQSRSYGPRDQGFSSHIGIIRGRRDDAFTGRLAVLIDSESASASELLARVVQLEKRAFIVGDRSSGRVMEAKRYPHEVPLDSQIPYVIEVAEADLVMADGKNLEHVGVEN
jgi:C-terminal processing protease CtpA/Prc